MDIHCVFEGGIAAIVATYKALTSMSCLAFYFVDNNKNTEYCQPCPYSKCLHTIDKLFGSYLYWLCKVNFL